MGGKDDRFDPLKMLGHDLKDILTMVEIAPVTNIASFVMAGLDAAGNITHQVIFPARNMPYIITFRTGFTMMPAPLPPALILVSNMATPNVDSLVQGNSIPMDLLAHDQFTTIVRPGEEWRAGSTTINAVLTVITRSMELVAPAVR